MNPMMFQLLLETSYTAPRCLCSTWPNVCKMGDESVKCTCLPLVRLVDLVLSSPKADISLSSGCLEPPTPSPSIPTVTRSFGWGLLLFTAKRILCAQSQNSMAGWAWEQPAAHTHTQATWPSHGGCWDVYYITITKDREENRLRHP